MNKHAIQRASLIVASIALLSPGAAWAQARCVSDANAPIQNVNQAWMAPLDRMIALRLQDVSLRDALDRVAAAARLRFSYSSDRLPLDRRVCAALASISVGDALALLLQGTGVGPIGAGTDHVVLAPGQERERVADHTHEPQVIPLERIVVTGSATGIPRRPLTYAVDVVEGEQLARQNISSLPAALAAAVPGMWMWQQSPATLLAQYASIRGASSFGLSYPKVYVDGIEVANPLLLTRLTPETIDRIETIRGPQGAALYGADAISGVVNIVTRNNLVSGGGVHTHVQSSAGVSASSFAPGGVLTQDHTLALGAGTSARSAGLTVTAGTLDEFIPGAFTREFTAHGRASINRARSNVTGTFRFFAQQAGSAVSPLLVQDAPGYAAGLRMSRPRGQWSGTVDSVQQGDVWAMPGDSADPQSIRQYTLGMTAKFLPGDRWTHSLVLGLDGYRLTNAASTLTPLPTPVDSALQAASGGADRATLRFSSVARFGDLNNASALLTLAAEHSTLRKETGGMVSAGPSGPTHTGYGMYHNAAQWQSNTGLIAQVNASLHDGFFLTSGLRLERNEGLTGAQQVAALPMLGAAIVRETPFSTIKLRASYGKGIRPAQPATRDLAWRAAYAQAELAAEEQSGIETGLDLLFGSRLAVQITRFDQRASGLIQQVAVPTDPLIAQTGRRSGPGVRFETQNVGEISNRGWELQATIDAGTLSLTGNLSLVDSRVERVAFGYGGDLRPGDTMLGVPARTASATAAWSSGRWFASLTAARAYDWIDYDRLALARDYYASNTDTNASMVGPQLRAYWRDYDGVTRLRAVASRDVFRGIVLSLTGENLLNYQRGEPDNVTVLPGRTITLGLQARF